MIKINNVQVLYLGKEDTKLTDCELRRLDYSDFQRLDMKCLKYETVSEIENADVVILEIKGYQKLIKSRY